MSSRRYITWTVIVSLGLASIVASSELYWRFIAKPSLGYPDFVRCQVSPSTLHYGIADIKKLHDLRTWFRHTQRCSVPKSVLDCQLEIVSNCNKTPLKISSFGGSSLGNRQWAYIQWHGHIRRGSLSELQAILCEPTSIADPESTRSMYSTVFYYDTNDDGELDRKEAPLDCHAALVWRDTDFDGYFDEEFGFDHNSGWKGDSSTIRVRVPDAPNREGNGRPIETGST